MERARRVDAHARQFLAHTGVVHAQLALARQPQFDALAAGEVITTGTLTAALPIGPGETWSSEYGGLPVTGLRLILTA
ncbi:hypothetical protein D3C83_24670 [compost metagenome]